MIENLTRASKCKTIRTLVEVIYLLQEVFKRA